MTSKVTSATVNEVKFASKTENIKDLTLSDIKTGFAGCDGQGIPMTSANFNAVLNWITENIGLQEDIVVETIGEAKYLTVKAKDGSTAKIKLETLIEMLRDEGLLTIDDIKLDKTLQRKESTLGVKLSEDDGNLLEERKNGLYYGIKPPKDTSNLYVSSSQGDDKNAGTKESPLRTINEAFKRNRANQHFRVNLYEDDIHEWRASWGDKRQYTYTMEPYGPVATRTFENNPTNSIGWVRSKELKRPIVEFVLDLVSYGELQSSVQVSFSAEEVVFNGLQFRIRQVAEATSIPWGDFGGGR